jgi:hypothetical protein
MRIRVFCGFKKNAMYIKKVLVYRINYNEIIGFIIFISRYFNISSL